MTTPDRTPRKFTSSDEVLAITRSALERVWPRAFWDDEDSYSAPKSYTLEKGVAVVSIEGPLESRGGWWWDGYGGPRGICARVSAALADPAALSVLLSISSPGGACSGLFETIDALRAAKASAKKPVIAYTDGGAFSAAYALATVADKILVGRAAGVGSIGVIAVAASFAKQLEAEGVQVAVLSSGEQKSDLHPMLPLAEGAVGRLQARVDELAMLFAQEVGRSRGMDAKAVLALQAACLHGQAAVEAKLADGVTSYPEALATARSAARLSRPESSQTTGAKRAAHLRLQAGAVPMDELVKKICAALGLPETATEEEILAAIEALKSSTATAQEETQSARKQLAELRGQQEQKERAALVAKGRANGTITPHTEKTLVPSLSLQQLRDLTSDGAPRKVPADPPAPPATTDATAPGGKRWESMTSMEKHDLYYSNRALYDVLRDAHKQRTSR